MYMVNMPHIILHLLTSIALYFKNLLLACIVHEVGVSHGVHGVPWCAGEGWRTSLCSQFSPTVDCVH